MAAFAALLIAILRELEARRRRAPDDELVRASYLMVLGGLVVVSTHHGWLDLTSGTFVWAAIALGLPERLDDDPDPLHLGIAADGREGAEPGWAAGR